MSIPQRIAAVPAYISSHNKESFKDAAPGHKFLGYFRNWQGSDGDAFSPYKGKAKIIGQIAPGAQRRAANDQLKSEFDAVLNEVCALPANSIAQVAALRTRQKALIQHHGAQGYRISTISTAPFATGLGNEHPIENGFAFLTPYGLPYLAGSGVKGILRRAMQELMVEGEGAFTEESIEALFGPEEVNQPGDARRGALDCWDVFPNPAGGKLVVEIMTPHYSKYYQGEEAPHDSGAPVPVSFLAVPAKSQFDFHVVCHVSRLPASLKSHWRSLLDRAFQHAFEWVGFGAKTSVGYGVMSPVVESPSTTNARVGAELNGPGSLSSHDDNALQVWPGSVLNLNPSTGEIKASSNGRTTVGIKGQEADTLRADLGEERATKLKKNKELKGVAVVVQQNGNMYLLKGLSAT